MRARAERALAHEPEKAAWFWQQVAKVEPDKCWLWQGNKDKLGYGHFYLAGAKVAAHRASVFLTSGEIPESLHIDHLCKNPSCVKPGHLEPVPSRTNTRRGRSPVGLNYNKTHCHQGHPLSGLNLYMRPNGERECRACTRARTNKYERGRQRGLLRGIDLALEAATSVQTRAGSDAHAVAAQIIDEIKTAATAMGWLPQENRAKEKQP